MKSPYVYISGSLTVMTEEERVRLRTHYETIGKIVEKRGYGSYCPHTHSDPTKNADLTPQEVDVIDRTAVMSSALVIADVTIPALGVGIEIEYAYHANNPAILIKEKGARVSRLALGNPAVIAVIEYERDDMEALEIAILTELDKLCGQVSAGSLPDVLKAVVHPRAT
jgi:hypothetical protein